MLKNIFILLFILIGPAFAEDPKTARDDTKAHLAKLKVQLKTIGTIAASNYLDEGPRNIPHWKKLGIDEELMSYIHPETGKREDVLIVEGVEFSGDADLALAATKSPVGGLHVVVWEDGHVSTVDSEKFKSLAVKMGLVKAVAKEISEAEKSELDKLISKLGAKKFSDRKAAKEELLKKDCHILTYLEKFQNDDDFEVQVSVKEIIKELQTKSAPKRRVKK